MKHAPSRLSAIGLVLALIGLTGLAQSAPPPAAPEAHVVAAAVAAGPVDVNAASAAELTTLPRIGPALAARIVEDRETNGPYRSLDELDRVPGIGPTTIARLRSHAVVGPTSTE